MKALLIKLLCLALSISFILSATSCKQKDSENEEKSVKVESWDEELISSDPKNAKYEYFFESVEALLYAIKREPDKYNNTRIKVIGTIQKGYDGLLYDTRLVDYTMTAEYIPSNTGVADRYDFRKILDQSDSKIDFSIASDAQYAVAESGDYVKLYGTVKITRDQIIIDKCEYVLIATLDERIETIRDKLKEGI